MSCRRKGASASSAPAPTIAAADVDDRQLSEAARVRAEKKNAGGGAQTGAAPATPVPWAMLVVGAVMLVGMLYLTVKFS